MRKLKSVNQIPKEALRKEPFLRKLSFRKCRNLFLGIIVILFFVSATLKQLITISLLKSDVAESKAKIQGAKVKLNQLQSQYVQLEKIIDQTLRESSQKME
jgi:hypothetical protein